MPARDADGYLRILEPAGLPLPRDVMEIHEVTAPACVEGTRALRPRSCGEKRLRAGGTARPPYAA
jgi:hypothetical protein